MARPLRLEFGGALYHITARGDERDGICFRDGDRRVSLSVLGDVCHRFNWVVHAYCLMGNHYHLLVETPEANLSKGMRQLNGVYTQRFNKTHDRVGHVFQGQPPAGRLQVSPATDHRALHRRFLECAAQAHYRGGRRSARGEGAAGCAKDRVAATARPSSDTVLE